MIRRFIRLSQLTEELEEKICMDKEKEDLLRSVAELKDTIAISIDQE